MKRIISFLLVLVIACNMAGCSKSKKEKFTDYSFDYFDTVTMIVGYEESKEIFDNNCKEIKKLFEEYHQLYNIYNVYEGVNNLCIINRTTDGAHKELEVDNKIIEMLEYSRELYDITEGNMNVAMGSVLSIWHDYRESGLDDPAVAQIPPMDALKAAAEHTDINNVIINKDNKTVFLSDPEMKLDVGAIAKGYAVEKVAEWMLSNGMEGYSLNVGGNIRIVGKRADGNKWKVGVENPDKADVENPYIEYLMLEDMSVVTSGVYQRYYEVEGKKYHHIIDPETLMPGDDFMSVTIVCKSSALGDALSTALFNLDYEKGVEIINNIEEAEAMWVLANGERKYSEGFKSYCVE